MLSKGLAHSKSWLNVSFVVVIIIISDLNSLVTNYLALTRLLPPTVRSSFIGQSDLCSFSGFKIQWFREPLGLIHPGTLWTTPMGDVRTLSLCSHTQMDMSWKINEDDTHRREKSSLVWPGPAWNLALLGEIRDRCFMTATSCASFWEWWQERNQRSRMTWIYFLGKILLARFIFCLINGQGGNGEGRTGFELIPLCWPSQEHYL